MTRLNRYVSQMNFSKILLRIQLLVFRFAFRFLMVVIDLFIYFRRRLYKYDLEEHDIIASVIPGKDIYVRSIEGFVPITAAHIRKRNSIYRLTLAGGLTLECADEHMVATKFGYNKWVKDLRRGESIMTKHGPRRVISVEPLGRKSHLFDITVASESHLYYTGDILSLNSIVTAIFIVWYLMFNTERNVMCTSQNKDKVVELMDKISVILKNLPFYMKPGMITNNQMVKTFDSGCKLVAQTTTENTGASFTIHLLYSDEFALIPQEIIKEFFRTIYPTLSSSKISRMIITSTPRGLNKFYEIYRDALASKNNFNPIRTDWYEVEGRGDEWKAEQVADLGSEEDFNQEFGNQFFAGSTLLLHSSVMKKLKRTQLPFVFHELEDVEEIEDDNTRNLFKYLTWHPEFDLDCLLSDSCRFVLSIDLADGVGADFSVINIFQVIPMSKHEIEALAIFSNEKDFFKLVQVGMFRSNVCSVPEVAAVFYHIVCDIMVHDNVKAVLEMNHEGNYFRKIANTIYGDDNRIEAESIYVKFKYNMGDEEGEATRTGLTNTSKTKDYACKQTKDKIRNNQLVPLEFTTVEEALSFAKNKKGSYSSQTGNDDAMMTVINVTHFIESDDFVEMVEELFDFMPKNFMDIIEAKLNKAGPSAYKDEDEDDFADML